MLKLKDLNAFCVFIYLFGPQIALAYSPKSVAVQVDPESFDTSLAIFGNSLAICGIGGLGLSCLCVLAKMTFEHAHYM